MTSHPSRDITAEASEFKTDYKLALASSKLESRVMRQVTGMLRVDVKRVTDSDPENESNLCTHSRVSVS